MKPGAKVTVAVLRDGKRVEQEVTIGRPPGTRMAAADRRGEEEGGAHGFHLVRISLRLEVMRSR